MFENTGSSLGGTEGVFEDSTYSEECGEKPEAEVPVPDRLLPKGRSQELVFRLRLSQKIGLLLYLNRTGSISEGGKERLLYLQEKASFEAISAGLKFAQRLSSESKLSSDFKHQLRELNRRPQSKRFRVRESRRIGVGYRDKGTLPEISSPARRSAIEASWINLQDLPTEMCRFLTTAFPTSVEGDWFDLSVLATSEKKESELRISQLLNRL